MSCAQPPFLQFPVPKEPWTLGFAPATQEPNVGPRFQKCYWSPVIAAGKLVLDRQVNGQLVLDRQVNVSLLFLESVSRVSVDWVRCAAVTSLVWDALEETFLSWSLTWKWPAPCHCHSSGNCMSAWVLSFMGAYGVDRFSLLPKESV